MDTPGLERLRNLHFSENISGLEELIETGQRLNVENRITGKQNFSTAKATDIDQKICKSLDDDETGQQKDRSSLQDKAKEFLEDNPLDGYNSKVFVGNISFKVKEWELREFFQYFGKVLRVQILKDRKTRRSRGSGFVIFSSPLTAQRAINAQPFELTLNGRVMRVHWAEKKKTLKAKRQQEIAEHEKHLKDLQDVVQQYSTAARTESRIPLLPVEDQSLIGRLNDDSLAYIISFLPLKDRIRAERVSKRWLSAARQSWVHIYRLHFVGVFKAFQGTGGLTDRIFVSVLKKATCLKSLDLSGSPYILTTIGLQSIGDYVKDLKHLELSRTVINSSCLKYIAENCKNIKTAIFERCQELGEKGLWWFLKSNKHIELLIVTESVRITGQCFHFLGKKLHTLKLTSCSKISDTCLSRLAEACGDTLNNLDISGCKGVTSSGLTLLFKGCSNIQQFEMCQTPYIDCVSGLENIRQLSLLEELNLSSNAHVHDSVLHSLTTGCQRLRSLNIEACHSLTKEGLLHLTEARNLEKLNVSYLTELTDDIVKDLAVSGKLKVFISRACSQLSNNALLWLLKLCDNLVEVDLSSCYMVKDTMLADEDLVCRDDLQTKVKIFVGGTSLTSEVSRQLEQKIGQVLFLFECRTMGVLRNDRDPTICARFYPSDSEDEIDEDEFKKDTDSAAEEYLLNDDPTVVEDFYDDVCIS